LGALTVNLQTTSQHFSQNRETKVRANYAANYHYTPEKYRMECVWKSLSRYRVRRLPENSVRSLELAKGIEPPTL
jgi:hypothetical protein